MISKIRLFQSFYLDGNASRQDELEYCLTKNLMAGFFNTVILCDDVEAQIRLYTILKSQGLNPQNSISITIHRRPTYNDIFAYIKKFSEDAINVIANSDIYFDSPNPILDFMNHNQDPDIALALSRWDITENGTATHFDRADSQDTWVFRGYPKFETSEGLRMGVAGCDNRLAYEMEKAGYRVLNPSKSIVTKHLHLTNIRHYINESGNVIDRVPPPYSLVNPY